VIGAVWDPATAYSNAVTVAQMLPSSRRILRIAVTVVQQGNWFVQMDSAGGWVSVHVAVAGEPGGRPGWGYYLESLRLLRVSGTGKPHADG
jgi:hypothetical protein